MTDFETAFKTLNQNQRKAVEAIEGPVMVVAGPGTGKTQVLTLRIANIIQKTDVGADSILCLTFTRSGVSAMKERLERYIGSSAKNVYISTFHSFASDIVDKYYSVLDFNSSPVMLDDTQAVSIVDEILHEHEWEHIRPRTNPSQYFGDLKSLISILKRERMSPEVFLGEVNKEIESLKEDPESISSRGESKGKIKKEVEKKMESLERTKEVVEFYRLYESLKKERNLMDYDDVLEYAVSVIEKSEDARDDIRESYQYILIDEHQDSSGIQNSFLKAVWNGVERPNIFVVGDDRQLIYGFSGASISYFEEFGDLFGKAQLITLSENYRSTEKILSLADNLLQSSISKEKLKSNTREGQPILLSEYNYERDEIIGAGIFFKEQISKGLRPEDCALLVPKNRHVRSSITILKDMGLPVSSMSGASLFSISEAQSLLLVLKIISNPYNSVLITKSLLDKTSGIKPMDAHKFIYENKYKDINLYDLSKNKEDLFSNQDQISSWGRSLLNWVESLSQKRLSEIISIIGTELLISKARNHEELLIFVEIVRSFLHIAIAWEEKNIDHGLNGFLAYIERLSDYNQVIEPASFDLNSGIKVMTLHKSKGLEYKSVWIAHMNEETLMSQKRQAFTLPETIKNKINERDIASARRELYVAITRAKEICSISYSALSYENKDLNISTLISDLPQSHFAFKDREETQKLILESSPNLYVQIPKEGNTEIIDDLEKYVRENYKSLKVSVTLLNNFFSCPWKWYFRNFLRLPEIKSFSLALGSVVHSTIEFILKQDKKPTEKILEEKINAELQREGVIDKKELKHLTKDAFDAVSNWLEKYYPKLSKDRISERSISFKDVNFPELLMYGKIDLTERFLNGDISVTDFKTGGVKTSSNIEKLTEENRLSDLMRQLAMYSYLIKGAENGSVVTSSRLLFVEADEKDKNALYETHISSEQIDLLLKDIEEYDENLKTGKWINRRCNHKSYGANKECEYCEMAKVFKK